jgi:hypothetical protein
VSLKNCALLKTKHNLGITLRYISSLVGGINFILLPCDSLTNLNVCFYAIHTVYILIINILTYLCT